MSWRGSFQHIASQITRHILRCKSLHSDSNPRKLGSEEFQFLALEIIMQQWETEAQSHSNSQKDPTQTQVSKGAYPLFENFFIDSTKCLVLESIYHILCFHGRPHRSFI